MLIYDRLKQCGSSDSMRQLRQTQAAATIIHSIDFSGGNMFAFIPIACSVATALTCILAIQTGKGAMRAIERKKRRDARKARS
jgi:hypothetical protein